MTSIVYLGFSDGYTTNDIIYRWESKHETWNKEREIPQFVLRKIEMVNNTREYLTGKENCYLDRNYF
jgi:hypothetical protein